LLSPVFVVVWSVVVNVVGAR